MGALLDAAKRLPGISNSDDWEEAVEALLIDMASKIETGVMLQADYTRKTQELARERRASLHLAHRDDMSNETSARKAS